MNLRNKTLIVVGSFLVCLIVILYVAAQMELMISFANLEERSSQTDIARALNAISNELTSVGDLTDYWAARNDTYAFMTTGDPGFINYNTASGSLTNDSLRNMEILTTGCGLDCPGLCLQINIKISSCKLVVSSNR